MTPKVKSNLLTVKLSDIDALHSTLRGHNWTLEDGQKLLDAIVEVEMTVRSSIRLDLEAEREDDD